MIRIRVLAYMYYTCNIRNPQNSIGNYLGPCIMAPEVYRWWAFPFGVSSSEP